MKVCEITLHGTDSIYLLAPTKYRALELVGDYLADARRPDMLQSSKCELRTRKIGLKSRRFFAIARDQRRKYR